jgi:hypothetical protein
MRQRELGNDTQHAEQIEKALREALLAAEKLELP